MWESRMITSSAAAFKSGAKRPSVALPHPTRMLRRAVTVDDRGVPHPERQLASPRHFQPDFLSVGHIRDGSGRREPVLSRQQIDPADGQHLGPILLGGYHSHLPFSNQHISPFFPHLHIRIDLDQDIAVTQRGLGHHGHHVHILLTTADNGRGRFAVGIGSAGTDGGDQWF